MLNKDNVRELAYLVYVDAIEPIEGKDRVEAAVVGGWRTMVRKGLFKPGDIGIYIEVDSQTPETAPFEFLAKYHFKVKTQKFKTFYSQGLLMHPSDFGWTLTNDMQPQGVIDNNKDIHFVNEESRFLTKQLGITYAVAEDNKRKAPSIDKYKKMAQRRPDLFKKNWARWMMKHEWGKKVMFFLFGKQKDKRGGWPQWVKKTDEERIENLPYLLNDKETKWFATEKVDGSSSTFTLHRKKGFFICSRNVCFDTPEKMEKCFYDTNIYTEMAYKYNIEQVLRTILKKDKNLEFITFQGETYGEGVQKKTYHISGHDLAIFNVIFGYKTGEVKRLNPEEMINFMKPYDIPCVPLITKDYILPDSIDELRAFVHGAPSLIDNEIKEGIVFRSIDGVRSFKCVDPEFLIQFH